MEEVRKQGVESLFCPYEQALELKELGFDEPCFAFYGLSRDDYKTIRLSIFQNLKTDYLPDVHHLDVTCDAPLFQQALRFLREKYGLHYIICKNIQMDGYGYREVILSSYMEENENTIFKTYEEARLECLKKLSEIAKEQNVK